MPVTAHPSATTLADLSDEPAKIWLTLARREEVIADIIDSAIDRDRQLRNVQRAIYKALGEGPDGHHPTIAEVAHPAQVADAVGSRDYPIAQLAALLYPAIAELVDTGLRFDPDWRLENWTHDRQDEVLGGFFRDAGIGERFMPRAERARVEVDAAVLA